MRAIATLVFVTVLALSSTATAQTFNEVDQFKVTCDTEPTEIGGKFKTRDRWVTVQVPETSGPVTIWVEGTRTAGAGADVQPDRQWVSGGKLRGRLKVMCEAVAPAEVRVTEAL